MLWLYKDPVVIMKKIMFWLFKDLINSGLAQFDLAKSNSKKWPKGWKNQIAPNEFCSRKGTKKAPFILQNICKINLSYYFCLPIGPFHCAKFKRILTTDPELWRCTIGAKVIKQFFLENYYYHSHVPISAFHCAKF